LFVQEKEDERREKEKRRLAFAQEKERETREEGKEEG